MALLQGGRGRNKPPSREECLHWFADFLLTEPGCVFCRRGSCMPRTLARGVELASQPGVRPRSSCSSPAPCPVHAVLSRTPAVRRCAQGVGEVRSSPACSWACGGATHAGRRGAGTSSLSFHICVSFPLLCVSAEETRVWPSLTTVMSQLMEN